MNEINGFKVSGSAYEALSFKKEPAKAENSSLGQADFLTLLITQLENQSPLTPLDVSATGFANTTEFVINQSQSTMIFFDI